MSDPIEEMIREQGESLPIPASLASRVRRHRGRMRLLASGAVVCGLVGWGIIAMPRTSDAKELIQRAIRGVSDAKVMQMDHYSWLEGQKPQLIARNWIRDNQPVYELLRPGMESVTQVKSGRVLTYSPRYDVLQSYIPASSPEFPRPKEDPTAAELIQFTFIDGDGKRMNAPSRIEKRTQWHGKTATRLTYKSDLGRFVAHLYIEDATGRPITLLRTMRDSFQGTEPRVVHERTEFTYDTVVPNPMGKIGPKTRQYDMAVWAAKLAQMPTTDTPFGKVSWAWRGPQRSLFLITVGQPREWVAYKGVDWKMTWEVFPLTATGDFSVPNHTPDPRMVVYTPLSTHQKWDLPFPLAPGDDYPDEVFGSVKANRLLLTAEGCARVRNTELRKRGDEKAEWEDLQMSMRERVKVPIFAKDRLQERYAELSKKYGR